MRQNLRHFRRDIVVHNGNILADINGGKKCVRLVRFNEGHRRIAFDQFQKRTSSKENAMKDVIRAVIRDTVCLLKLLYFVDCHYGGVGELDQVNVI